MRLRLLVLLPAAPFLAGCFSYRPVIGTPPAGADLEATLTEAGTARLTATVGPNAGVILGSFAGARGDTLDLAISEVRTTNGLAYFLKGTTVGILREDLAQLRVRQLDKRRTAIAATLGVVGAAALAAGVQTISAGSDNTGGGGGNPAARPPE